MSTDVLAVIGHSVKDYDTWRVGYDAHAPARAKAGVTKAEVFRDPEDRNKVTIVLRFRDIAGAKGFFADPGLKEVMQKAGVVSAPAVTLAVAV
ncbi:MAG: cyclase [Pseudomonadota bacterium]|jgi:quinol monooxygenase YgiN